MLRDLRETLRCRQEPFVNGLSSPNLWICVQFERYPALRRRHNHAVTWEFFVVSTIFDGLNHCSVTWHAFLILIGILHMSTTPVEGHYQGVLFNSGVRPSGRLVRDHEFYRNIYMFHGPLPFAPIRTQPLRNLISEHFA